MIEMQSGNLSPFVCRYLFIEMSRSLSFSFITLPIVFQRKLWPDTSYYFFSASSCDCTGFYLYITLYSMNMLIYLWIWWIHVNVLNVLKTQDLGSRTIRTFTIWPEAYGECMWCTWGTYELCPSAVLCWTGSVQRACPLKFPICVLWQWRILIRRLLTGVTPCSFNIHIGHSDL